jgi:predicted ABC-type ATPase
LRVPPLLWLVIGPNGAGKTTYYETRIRPKLRTEFVNADRIADERWPTAVAHHALDAALVADALRRELLRAGRSLVAETVFSHPDKLEIVELARTERYQIWVTLVCVESPDLSLARVAERVARGGHDVPGHKIRSRYARMLPQAAIAVRAADRAFVVDNSFLERPLRDVILFESGRITYAARDLPEWARKLFARDLGKRPSRTRRT